MKTLTLAKKTPITGVVLTADNFNEVVKWTKGEVLNETQIKIEHNDGFDVAEIGKHAIITNPPHEHRKHQYFTAMTKESFFERYVVAI